MPGSGFLWIHIHMRLLLRISYLQVNGLRPLGEDGQELHCQIAQGILHSNIHYTIDIVYGVIQVVVMKWTASRAADLTRTGFR